MYYILNISINKIYIYILSFIIFTLIFYKQKKIIIFGKVIQLLKYLVRVLY